MSPRHVSILGLVLLANAIALTVPSMQPVTSCACDYRMPVLCAELPPDGEALACVLDDAANERETWRRQILLDLPFLVLYGLLIAAGGGRLVEGRRLRLALAAFAALGAALDACENFGILHALSSLDAPGVGDGLARWVRVCATAKFTCLSVACALACSGALRAGAAWSTRVGLGVPLALALVGVCSPLGGWAIEVALLGIFATCLALWVSAMHAAFRGPGPERAGE